MNKRYWRENLDAPFATLLGVLDTYCHPEAHDEAHDELVNLARNPEPTDEMIRFKGELRQVLSGDSEELPPDAISLAAEYSDRNDKAYLRRLWSELYPDEPIPEPAMRHP